MKKIILVTTVLVVGVLTILGGYSLRSRNAQPPNDNSAFEDNGDGSVIDVETPSSSGGLSASNLIHDKKIKGYLAKEGSVLVVEENGNVLEISGSNKTTLSTSTFSGISKASISPDGKMVLISTGENGRFSIVVLESGNTVSMPSAVKSAEWISDNELAYLEERSNRKHLLLWNPSSKNRAREIISLNFDDVYIAGGNDSSVFIAETPSAFTRGSIWRVDIAPRQIFKVYEGLGISSIWSSNGEKGLLFESNPNSRGGRLRLIDRSGAILENLSILTLPQKCAISENILFCGVPAGTGFKNSSLPDSFFKKDGLFNDVFYSIDLNNGVLKELPENTKGADGSRLSSLGDRIYFINRSDDRLYKLPIK